ncbi:MAG: helix-turn-helix domain-containing protein, partial [Candidatus Accumulibacter sp.]|nr:helix-turn-helix domain-containing protein [Accumulibacter sp.]
MRDDDILTGALMEECWLTLEQIASACGVEPEWLARHLDEGLLPHAESVAGIWRFSGACLLRARRMHELERNFDAVPELAALV